MDLRPILSFSEEDKIGTIQPHDDALLITLKIGDYDVKRVMVDGAVWPRLCTLTSTRGWG